MDLPPHPESDDSGPRPDPVPSGQSRAGTVVVAALVALVVVVLILHLTGIVGPGAH